MKSGNETREVMYHFFLSDDTTQDTEAVLCAKHFLYTEVLSCYGKKQVRFRSDGATCFSSKEAKSAMVLFDEIAKESDACFETLYKVSVAGCGKTALDVSFFRSLSFILHIYHECVFFHVHVYFLYCLLCYSTTFRACSEC